MSVEIFPWPQWASRIRQLAVYESATQIARFLTRESGRSISRKAVSRKIRQMGITLVTRVERVTPAEDQAKRELLKEMWAGPLGASAIAEELSRRFHVPVSKSAVIGMARRMKLPSRRQEIGGKKATPPKLPPKRPNRMVKIGHSFVPRVALAPTLEQRRSAAAAIASPPSVVMEPEAQAARCTIMEINDDRCRWIMGDSHKPLEAIYCGGRTSKRPWGSLGQAPCPYCDWHAEMAVGKKVA